MSGISTSLVQWFTAHNISAEWTVFIISMLPILELRGGLIAASLLKVPMWKAIFLCVAGNILPIPFILFYIKRFLHWLADHHFSKLVAKLEAKAEKNRPGIEKYGFWGLAIFVGIPRPGTGAWTGSLVAALFDMDLKKASWSILLGVFIACVIMTLVSYGVIANV